jgi:hypothetical protein
VNWLAAQSLCRHHSEWCADPKLTRDNDLHNMMPAYLQPPWFFLYFGVLWIGLTGLLARVSGWATLAQQFRSDESIEGQRFRFSSGSMGRRWIPVSYNNCLFVTVTATGLRLSLFPLFRFLSPSMFIPWTAVESITQKRILFVRFTTLVLREAWPQIALRGAAGDAIYNTCLAARPELSRPDATHPSSLE